MTHHNRLNTEELIQDTRDYYNASKYEHKVKEMELTIELKDKELQSLASRILSFKQESSTKISLLERQVVDLKKQIAQYRANTVKQRRMECDKWQKLLANLKKQHQVKIQHIQAQQQSKYEASLAKHREQIQRIEGRYQQLMQLQKKELLAFKSIQEDKTSNANLCMSRLQEEKSYFFRLKREAQQKAQSYKQSMQRLKQQYKKDIFQKEQELNAKNGEIQGLKLQEKLLMEKLETIKDKQFSSQSHSKQSYEQLKQLCQKLTKQNQQLNRMLQQKNEQILKYFKQITQKELQKVPINQIYECNHLSLINQMQKNLQFKEKEIANLKTIVEQWRSLIGFDKPLSQRLQEIDQKSLSVKNLNTSLSQGLKKCIKTSKSSKN